MLFPKEQFINLMEIEEEGSLALALDAIVTDMTIRDLVRKHLEEQPGDAPETKEWEDNLPFYEGQLWIPPSTGIQTKILQLYHNSPMAGHQGITATEELTARGYYWPQMNEFIKQYIRDAKHVKWQKRRT